MRALLLGVVVLVAGCSSAAVSTTTVATTTSTSTTTTSTVVTTTSSTMPSTTPVAAVDGVPEEALALIGAEMPAVPDLSDGFDAEVWFESYAAWNRWAFANPEEGLETLDLWVVPGSEYSVALEEQLGRQSSEGWRTVGTDSVTLLDAELAEEFIEEGFVTVNALTRSEGEVWVVDPDLEIVLSESFDDAGEVRSQITLELVEGSWLLSAWD